ncbi:MAG: hypothetical protein AAGB26_16940 [Planctomycetota bacterium]
MRRQVGESLVIGAYRLTVESIAHGYAAVLRFEDAAFDHSTDIEFVKGEPQAVADQLEVRIVDFKEKAIRIAWACPRKWRCYRAENERKSDT